MKKHLSKKECTSVRDTGVSWDEKAMKASKDNKSIDHGLWFKDIVTNWRTIGVVIMLDRVCRQERSNGGEGGEGVEGGEGGEGGGGSAVDS